MGADYFAPIFANINIRMTIIMWIIAIGAILYIAKKMPSKYDD